MGGRAIRNAKMSVVLSRFVVTMARNCALNETPGMTELRDPYSFPKLEGDDKFGPKTVRIYCCIINTLK